MVSNVRMKEWKKKGEQRESSPTTWGGLPAVTVLFNIQTQSGLEKSVESRRDEKWGTERTEGRSDGGMKRGGVLWSFTPGWVVSLEVLFRESAKHERLKKKIMKEQWENIYIYFYRNQSFTFIDFPFYIY